MDYDCMEGMKEYPDKFFDLAVVDPPYGIKENSNRDLRPKGAATVRKKYNEALWVQDAPDENYFSELKRISKNQIVWGGNYFPLGVSRCFLVWDKRDTCPGNDFADCELAWTSFTTSIRRFSYLWNGMLQSDMKNKEHRIHPTQKPIALYDWIYANYLPQGGKVIDTHLGSGSNRIAADKAGNIDFYAWELDKDYFEAQEKRFRNYKAQGVLFKPEQMKAA